MLHTYKNVYIYMFMEIMTVGKNVELLYFTICYTVFVIVGIDIVCRWYISCSQCLNIVGGRNRRCMCKKTVLDKRVRACGGGGPTEQSVGRSGIKTWHGVPCSD